MCPALVTEFWFENIFFLSQKNKIQAFAAAAAVVIEQKKLSLSVICSSLRNQKQKLLF